MNVGEIMDLFKQTAYVRMGGSTQELQCAEFLREQAGKLGLNPVIEPFAVPVSTMEQEKLTVDGNEIPCKGYLLCGSGEVEAPLYYLRGKDAYSLSLCRGKIVLIDGYLGYWMYHDLLENGAVGFITYDGNANYADRNIDQRELRQHVSLGNLLPGVNINAKDAIELIRGGATQARIQIRQQESMGESHNVIAEIPGKTDHYIAVTAHYDSTSLSQGAYDNMSGAIGLLGIAGSMMGAPMANYGLKFIWCGSEERGLLGSKAYCTDEERLKNCVLCINLDMIGCIMGKFIACVTAEDKLCGYISYLGSELGFGVSVKQDVYSSDSTPFADKGVPSLSFARIAPNNTATIHNSYDTMAVMKGEQMVEDIAFITEFTHHMAYAKYCPVAREIPENMKDKLDIYLFRKRDKE